MYFVLLEVFEKKIMILNRGVTT